MKFETQREKILKPLQYVGGVVEKRQTLPILSNVLVKSDDQGLSITATDLEIEVIAKSDIKAEIKGAITVPLRKFQDTCRTLSEGAQVDFEQKQDKAVLRSGKTRFTLTTMPAENFPVIETKEEKFRFKIAEKQAKHLIEKTQFAMALQDVRFYLNGLLLELEGNTLTAVATDGHRLALCKIQGDFESEVKQSIILPRKAVIELARLLSDSEELVEFVIGENFLKVELPEISFTSKLIDGQYPNYQAVIPAENNIVVYADRDTIKQCLVRTSILSNEKYRGIRIQLEQNSLIAMANNPEQEEAQDEIEVDYGGEKLEIGFNVNYLLDAITAVQSEIVKITFADVNGSALITSQQGNDCLYVVMPMRL